MLALPIKTGTVGASYTYQIEATESPTSYTLASGTLPTGLNLDTTSGVISGTPSVVGYFSSTVTASNGAGTSDPAAFNFTIAKGIQSVGLPDLNATLEDTQFTLPATTEQGLPIQYVSDDETVATIAGNVLTIVGIGSTNILAGNDGDANYELFTGSFTLSVTDAPAGPCGMENFNNSALTTSYANGSFVGNGGITWSYVQSRDKNNQAGIDGAAIMLRRASDNSAISSSAISTGIGNFSVKLYKGFTGSGPRQVELFINGISHGISSSFDDNVEHLFEVNNINISGDFTLQIKNITGSQVILDDISWTCFATSSTTWTGTWSNGNPDATKDVIIAGDYSGESFTARALTVNAGVTLTVPSSGFIETGEVNNNGHIIVANNANFVQTGTFTPGVTSTFKVNRTTKQVRRLDYNAWSSPMKNSTQTLKQFSAGTLENRFLTYNGGLYVSTSSAGTFSSAQGYLIRTPNNFTTTPQVFNGIFEGIEPNTGTVNFNPSAITGEYVFLGNPYPSTVNMQSFAAANPQIGSTFYIWNSAAEMDSNDEYSGSNYITHTSAGSVPAGSPFYIPVAQGFFVDRGADNTSLSFNDGMRETTETGVFAKAGVMDKFWLQMTSPSAAEPQMLIGFDSNATAGFDTGYDAKMFDSNADVIYATVDNKSLIINVLGSFDITKTVNVTANFLAAGNYTMNIAKKEGVFANEQQIYLKDNVTGVETELNAGGYTFAATAGLQADRFTLTFSKGVLASANVTKDQSTIYAVDQIVYVKAASKIATVEVYDMSGKLMKTTKNVNSENTSLPVAYKGISIVKLTLENGEVVTKKIILK